MSAKRSIAAYMLVAVALGFVSPTPCAPLLAYRVVAQYPHDTSAFTEGLAWYAGALYESTGLYGHSSIRQVEPMTGRVVRSRPLPTALFGEGLTRFDGHWLQLTWTQRKGIVYDDQFNPAGTFSYSTEGWGVSFDNHNKRLVLSDGTSQLHYFAARDLSPAGGVTVRDGARAVANLNELEVAGAVIFANVWHQDRIARIDSTSGAVTGWIDLSALRTRFTVAKGWDATENVLNGIAYNPTTKHLYVTGKCWPALFELELPTLTDATP